MEEQDKVSEEPKGPKLSDIVLALLVIGEALAFLINFIPMLLHNGHLVIYETHRPLLYLEIIGMIAIILFGAYKLWKTGYFSILWRGIKKEV